jgi:hypothetical protein
VAVKTARYKLPATVCCALSHPGPVHGSHRRDRWQQVQGDEQPGQELHTREDEASHGADRGERQVNDHPSKFQDAVPALLARKAAMMRKIGFAQGETDEESKESEEGEESAENGPGSDL